MAYEASRGRVPESNRFARELALRWCGEDLSSARQEVVVAARRSPWLLELDDRTTGRFHLPQPKRTVQRGGGDSLAVGQERGRGDVVIVTTQDGNLVVASGRADRDNIA